MQGITTDKVNKNTNPKETNVIYEGNIDVVLSSVTSGYRGSATVELPFDTEYAGLDVEAWARFSYANPPANTRGYLKMPYAYSDSDGAFAGSGWIGIYTSPKDYTYLISFSIQEADLIDADTVTIYYRLLSNVIQPGGLSFV